MNTMPDFVGFLIDDALSALGDSGYDIRIVETMDSRNKEKNGECRIVKQNHLANVIELTVSYF